MPIPLIGGIIAGVVELGKTIGGGILEKAKIKTQGKIDIKKAKIKMRCKRFEQIGEMDVSAMNQMQFSWKDEYLLIIFSIPIILAFIPPMVPYVTAGFAVLKALPAWYQWSITGMVAATFGLRTWKGLFR